MSRYCGWRPSCLVSCRLFAVGFPWLESAYCHHVAGSSSSHIGSRATALGRPRWTMLRSWRRCPKFGRCFRCRWCCHHLLLGQSLGSPCPAPCRLKSFHRRLPTAEQHCTCSCHSCCWFFCFLFGKQCLGIRFCVVWSFLVRHLSS